MSHLHHLLVLPLMLALGTAPLAAAVGGPARTAPGGQVYLTVEEALALAFPECEVEKATVYLTEEQRERAEELAGFEVERRIVRPYVATREGKLVGTAYFDVHRVRTKKESLMIVVAPDGRIRRVELLAFAEPEEYAPRGKWYGQFVGKRLDAELSLKRGIRGVTGATLTARATTEAARRSLALHAVIHDLPEPEPEPEPDDEAVARE